MRLVTASPGRARLSRTEGCSLRSGLLPMTGIAHTLKILRFVPIGHRDDVVSDRRLTHTTDHANRLSLQHRLTALRPVLR